MLPVINFQKIGARRQFAYIKPGLAYGLQRCMMHKPAVKPVDFDTEGAILGTGLYFDECSCRVGKDIQLAFACALQHRNPRVAERAVKIKHFQPVIACACSGRIVGETVGGGSIFALGRYAANLLEAFSIVAFLNGKMAAVLLAGSVPGKDCSCGLGCNREVRQRHRERGKRNGYGNALAGQIAGWQGDFQGCLQCVCAAVLHFGRP